MSTHPATEPSSYGPAKKERKHTKVEARTPYDPKKCHSCDEDINGKEIRQGREYTWHYGYYRTKHDRRYCSDCAAIMAADSRPGQSPLRPAEPSKKSPFKEGEYW